MVRRIITIIVVIAVVLGLGVFMARNKIWPQSATCTSPVFPISPMLQSGPAPLAPPATQVWGNPALGTSLPIHLPNGHVLRYLSSLPDATNLVDEYGQCGAAWISTYDPSTRTTHQLCSGIAGGGTDGHYVAWVSGDFGYTGEGDVPPQDVGYMDLHSCKRTQLFHSNTTQMYSTVTPSVSNGYFFWTKGRYGTIYMTDMSKGKTNTLPLSGELWQVNWPYLLYRDQVDHYYLYNLETEKKAVLAWPSDLGFPLNPVLLSGPTIDWTGNTQIILQTDHADQPDSLPHTIFTIPDSDPKPEMWVTDRLFIWQNGDYLYAWDRILNKEVVLPDGIDQYRVPHGPVSFQVYGNVLVLTSTPDTYIIIDTSKLPIIPLS